MKKVVIFLLTALLLCGCTSRQEAKECTFFAMDTVMSVKAYGASDSDLEKARLLVTELEGKLSVTNPQSDIYRLNDSGSADLSEDSTALLMAALELCRRTDGALDVTIYPVIRSWGFTGDGYQIPDDDTLAALLQNVDYRRIVMDGMSATLPEGMMVDLGSVGKGYTGDMLTQLLRSAGITSACVNLGGNVQTIGGKPDGTGWRVGIQDPESEDYAGVLELRDLAAITSGMYQRFFIGDDGAVYGHIMDPETGKPADSGLQSVTVVGKSGVICDGLSTALFVSGLEKSLALWQNSSDFEAVFILEDGSIVVTEGLSDSFTLNQRSRNLTVIERKNG